MIELRPFRVIVISVLLSILSRLILDDWKRSEVNSVGIRRQQKLRVYFLNLFCSQCKTSHVELTPTELSLAKEKSKTEELTKKLSKLSVELGELEMRFMLKVAELEKKIEMLKTEVEVASYERNVLKERVDGKHILCK